MRRVQLRTSFCLLLVAGSAAGEPLRVEGELYARERAALMPPSIDQLWQLNITRLAPDGDPVAEGDVVIEFDGSQLQTRLREKQSTLAEKQSQLDKLLLELADRERAEQIAVAEARAASEKARRKASQPEDLLRGIDYRKLVAEREHAERALELAQRRSRLAADARRQERRLLDSELQSLRGELQRLQQGLASLQVRSPRAGIMQHLSDWQGNKFEVGSQVWRGMAVAQVPDPASLAVQATMPEHLIGRVRVDQPVKVVIEGGGATLAGRITALGRVVRSKSRLQPVPVLDLDIDLDAPPAGLKPGQAVRVELQP